MRLNRTEYRCPRRKFNFFWNYNFLEKQHSFLFSNCRRDIDRSNKQQAMRDFVKRARLSADKLPSICFYTILNSYNKFF